MLPSSSPNRTSKPAAVLLGVLLGACSAVAPQEASNEPASSTTRVDPPRASSSGGGAPRPSAAIASVAAPAVPVAPPASVAVAASASASGASASGAPAPASSIDLAPLMGASRATLAQVNKERPPLESEDLTGQARRLFGAIQADEPSQAADFFFPREPFIPLKDIKNPGKYWDQLYRVYEQDIHQLHRKRKKELEGAVFEGFALGTAPTFVNPGEEGNKIGYHRTFRGKLRYRTADGQQRTLETRVIISWAGRWYITHLLPFKKH